MRVKKPGKNDQHGCGFSVNGKTAQSENVANLGFLQRQRDRAAGKRRQRQRLRSREGKRSGFSGHQMGDGKRSRGVGKVRRMLNIQSADNILSHLTHIRHGQGERGAARTEPCAEDRQQRQNQRRDQHGARAGVVFKKAQRGNRNQPQRAGRHAPNHTR